MADEAQKHEKLAYAAANEGRWNDMLQHASNISKSWDFYQTLPSAYPHMPADIVHKVMDRMHEDSGFPHEYMTNLPDDADPTVLRRLWENHADNYSYNAALNIRNHPNFSRSDDEERILPVANFWRSYEGSVQPGHFATIKSLHTGKPETIKDHRGKVGESYTHEDILPHLKEYANKVQDKIMKDPDIRKRYKDGEAYIKVHRGIAGLYGKKIRDVVKFNPKTHESQSTALSIPVAPLTSWSTDSNIANGFANRPIDGQPNDQGLVISKWMPVKSIIHSGYHNVIPRQDHYHTGESEVVFEHPTNKMRIHSKNISFKPEKTIDFSLAPKPAKLTKAELELLEKNMKHKAMAVAAAASMLGYTPNLKDLPQTNSIVSQVSQKPKPQAHVLHNQLRPIAMIESSGGKNTNHPVVTAGLSKDQKAIGAHGLMPLTVSEVIKKNPQLQHKYPELVNLNPKIAADHDKIHDIIKKTPNAYTEIINNHWKRLNDRFHGDLHRMVYAWRNGITGALSASQDEIDNHPYVQKYNKYQKMIDLEHPPKDLEKAELHPQTLDQKTSGITRFIPYEITPDTVDPIRSINTAIKEHKVHDLSHEGHFTHKSFVVGFDPDNSWLIKVDVPNKPGAASAKEGSQALKEYVYYAASKDVFQLSNYLPESIFGYIEKDGEKIPSAAIKLLSPDHVNAIALQKQRPGSIIGILDKHRQDGVLHKLAAMAYILGDVDQHGGNFMTNGHDLYSIDHGTSFADDTFTHGGDGKTFIPYILRAGRVRSKMSPTEKLDLMPKIDNPEVLNHLKYWIFSLDSNRLTEILNKYQIDPEPSVKRLNELKEKVQQMRPDQAINSLWVLGENNESQTITI